MATIMIRFLPGLFVEAGKFQKVKDNLDLERWLILAKSHERRIQIIAARAFASSKMGRHPFWRWMRTFPIPDRSPPGITEAPRQNKLNAPELVEANPQVDSSQKSSSYSDAAP
jgi:hypothetical protein